MARQHEAPAPRRWLSGTGALDWRSDERGLASLLDALTRDRIEAETAEAERQATSRRSLADLQEDRERAARDELAEARRELDTFRAAIEDARAREREIRLGAEDYADEILNTLEVNLTKFIAAVQRGRDRLAGKEEPAEVS